MLNTLDDYICRSLPDQGDFATNPNLRQKVGENGSFLPFPGNTTVFLLDGETKAALHRVQDGLYQSAGRMLAERPDSSTFHMTLHDLENIGRGREGLEQRMERAEREAARLLAGWKEQKPLKMRTTWLFNMVNTSVVLGLTPADEDSRDRLDAMYTALETVTPLGYALTPHITMAYYRPGVYGQEELSALRAALAPVDLTMELPPEALVLQQFSDMNHYGEKITIF